MAESSGAGDVSARKRQAVELARAGRIDEAAALLETLAGSRSGADDATRGWAATQLEKLRSSRKTIDVAALCSAAEDLFRKYDYEQAAALLLPIPVSQRTTESKKLLERSIRLRDEVAELTHDLKENLAARQFETLDADVKRLLQICPPSSLGKRLKTALDTYRGIPASRRKYRVDTNGELLEAVPSRLIPGMVLGLVVFVSLGWGASKWLRDQRRDVMFQVSPAAAERLKAAGIGSLEIGINGTRQTLPLDGLAVRLASGTHNYEVFGDAVSLVGPVPFEVGEALPGLFTLDLPLPSAVAAVPQGPALAVVPPGPAVGVAPPPPQQVILPATPPPMPAAAPEPVPAPAPPAGGAPGAELLAKKEAGPMTAEPDPEAAAVDGRQAPFLALGARFYRDGRYAPTPLFIVPPEAAENRLKILKLMVDHAWIEGLEWPPTQPVTPEEVELVGETPVTWITIEARHFALLKNPKIRGVAINFRPGPETEKDFEPVTQLPDLAALRLIVHEKTKVTGGFLSRLRNPAGIRHYSAEIYGGHANYIGTIARFPELETLSVQWRDAGKKTATLRLTGGTRLRNLWINDVSITRDSYKALGAAPDLFRLSLRNTDTKDVDMAQLTGLRNLKSLSLASVAVTDKGLQALEGMTSLESVTLSKLPIKGPGLAFLKSQPNLDLKQLRLWSLDLTDEDVEVFGELPNVTTLDVSYLRLTQRGIKELAAMPHFEKLICNPIQLPESEVGPLTEGKSLKIEVRK